MRLIDADALERKIMGMPDEKLCEDCCYNVVNAIDAAKTVGGWISANEKLPEHTDCYLVYLKRNYGLELDVFYKEEGKFHKNPGLVDYWMSIPATPD